MKVWMYIVGVIVLVLAAGGGGFFGGTAYAQAQAQNAVTSFTRQRAVQSTDQNPTGQGQQFAGGGGFAAGGPCSNAGQAQNNPNSQTNPNTSQDPNATPRAGGQQRGGGLAQLGNCVARGTVKSVDGNTVTISTAESVVTVTLDAKTTVNMTLQGTASDVKVGDRVTVFSQDTGSNPTASMVQLQRGGQ